MPRGWPPLDKRDIEAILTALGLAYSHSAGGHDFWKGTRKGKGVRVTVSSHIHEFGPDLIKSMCTQAESDRSEFYGATKSTRKKIR